jgi:hypothetical protein
MSGREEPMIIAERVEGVNRRVAPMKTVHLALIFVLRGLHHVRRHLSEVGKMHRGAGKAIIVIESRRSP